MGPAPHRTSCQERDPHGTSCGPAWLLRSPPAASAGRPHCPQPWWRGEGHGVPRTGPLGHTRSPATAQLQPAPPALFLLRVLEGKGAGSLLAALPWPLCGLGLCSEAATPRHRQPGGILSLDKIQQQGAKFTRTIHTPLLTPSPALKTCAGFLYHLRFPGFTWDRAPITIQHGAKDCLWLKLLTGDQQSAARCFCACSPPQAPQQCTCLVVFPLH